MLADDDGALDPQGIQHLGHDVDVLVVGKGGSLVPGPVVLRDEPGNDSGTGSEPPCPSRSRAKTLYVAPSSGMTSANSSDE